jgi:hypothetical protein
MYCLLFLGVFIDVALAEPPPAEPPPATPSLVTTGEISTPPDKRASPLTVAMADEVHPSSSIPGSTTSGCYSDEEHDNLPFQNIGSLCVDGLFALMWGRGCGIIVGAQDPTGRWTTHRCETQPTCDPLHNSTFAVVPVGISLRENFGRDVHVWCTDNNYRVLRLPEK